MLLEGREQTVNYVRTPFRFTLTMSDPTLIGMRRAAQRIGAEAIKAFGGAAEAEDDEVIEKLKASLVTLASE